jgi:hypothetical protein
MCTDGQEGMDDRLSGPGLIALIMFMIIGVMSGFLIGMMIG